jgi:hypothetical protein
MDKFPEFFNWPSYMGHINEQIGKCTHSSIVLTHLLSFCLYVGSLLLIICGRPLKYGRIGSFRLKERFHSWNIYVQGGADNSLARPGRKQATVTKLRIYSMYSPRSSIHSLARCSNFCKPLKKKIQKVVHPTRSLWQQWPPCQTKNGNLSIVFQPTEQVVVRQGQIRRLG